METHTTTEIHLDGDWGPRGPQAAVPGGDYAVITLPDGTVIRGDYATVRESLIDMVEALETARRRSRPDLGGERMSVRISLTESVAKDTALVLWWAADLMQGNANDMEDDDLMSSEDLAEVRAEAEELRRKAAVSRKVAARLAEAVSA